MASAAKLSQMMIYVLVRQPAEFFARESTECRMLAPVTTGPSAVNFEERREEFPLLVGEISRTIDRECAGRRRVPWHHLRCDNKSSDQHPHEEVALGGDGDLPEIDVEVPTDVRHQLRRFHRPPPSDGIGL